MKKVGFILIAAVIVPSMILAWLSLRAQRDQELVLERQQWLLYQGVVDSIAQELNDRLLEYQRSFAQSVDMLQSAGLSARTCKTFDQQLRTNWPWAEVGFSVSISGLIGCPDVVAGGRARTFLQENGRFLGNTESAEVFYNSSKSAANNSLSPITKSGMKGGSTNRKTVPAQGVVANKGLVPSKFNPEQAEFQQLIGDSTEGTVARFVNNEPSVLFWYRPETEPNQIYGSQINLERLAEDIAKWIKVPVEHDGVIALALLNDRTKPVALQPAGFGATWSRPFVATEISETLPHWEIAAYLVDPGSLSRTAAASRRTLAWLVVTLCLAISLGGWLVLADVRRQLLIARQKTDFVSNVSHELKTPLTSIRMFSELLAEKEALPDEKRRSYVAIINNESARLTRLINNVLDFARLDRGENKIQLSSIDVTEIVKEVWEMQEPRLIKNGFAMSLDLPSHPIVIRGNHDAVSQIIVNLLSNAEKFSDERRDIRLELLINSPAQGKGELRVLDRGCGVPVAERERIFSQFYRVDDSLANGVSGVGLGLTLARQLARAQGGNLRHQTREDGGSIFVFSFSLKEDVISSMT